MNGLSASGMTANETLIGPSAGKNRLYRCIRARFSLYFFVTWY